MFRRHFLCAEDEHQQRHHHHAATNAKQSRGKADQMLDEFCEARARGRVRNERGRRPDHRGKALDVGDADGIRKELEHRHIVRRVADIHHRRAVPVEPSAELLAK